MKEINLEEIIKQYCYVTQNGQEDVHNSISLVKDAMKEACKQTLGLAAENAKTKLKEVNPNSDRSFYRDVVNKQSILDVINQVK